MNINLDLVSNLAKSNADNAVDSIVSEIRVLGERFGWTLEEAMAVGDLCVRARREGIVSTLDTAEIAIREARRCR